MKEEDKNTINYYYDVQDFVVSFYIHSIILSHFANIIECLKHKVTITKRNDKCCHL